MRRFCTIATIMAVTAVALVSSATAGVPQMINYQGRLTDAGGNPLTGQYSLQFTMYDSSSSGNILWQETHPAVSVTDGLFNVILGDGDPPVPLDLNYHKVWLGCSVGGDPELVPRTRLVSVPYALATDHWTFRITDGYDTTLTTRGEWGITRDGNTLYGNADSTHVNLGVASITGGFGDNSKYCTVAGGLQNTARYHAGTVGGGKYNGANGEGSTVGGGESNYANGYVAIVGGGIQNGATASWATIGGGGVNLASGSGATVAGGVQDTASGVAATVSGGVHNVASGHSATVGGGRGNVAAADTSVISGGENNQIIFDGSGGTIGGGRGNTVSGRNSTIAGGYDNEAGASAAIGGGWLNVANGGLATISGGANNTASGIIATVGGGENNAAEADSCVISGGGGNSISGHAGTIGGGSANIVDGWYGTVGGGANNKASGSATVPGGEYNIAAGGWSFAAGYQAKANHSGAFVWADVNYVDFPSTASNQFSARCTGGVRFVTGIDGSGNPNAGVQVAAGGGSWSSISDRNLKQNLTPVDSKELLEKLAALPISTWNYKAQDPSIRHIGPTAQDFYAAFGVGEDDKHITSIDADGVAFAAIQQLYEVQQELKEKVQRIEQLETKVAQLEALVETILARQDGSIESKAQLSMSK